MAVTCIWLDLGHTGGSYLEHLLSADFSQAESLLYERMITGLWDLLLKGCFFYQIEVQAVTQRNIIVLFKILCLVNDIAAWLELRVGLCFCAFARQ